MSYLVLARKYRPQTFDDVVKQDHVTQTLKNAITAGRVAHAILFSGPRGTGKTTIARILAKSMNCEKGPTPTPCNTCRSCVEITRSSATDVYEIDGASNNSVDQIRELRDNIKYMPAHSSYKIYIIDEVHMLSIAAFNALLKTLEEPPHHVMFLFATTEPHKIPVTILSRCQQHDLRRIDAEAIAQHLATLCQLESIEITQESLNLIAKEADGCMRDALSLLDQVISFTEGAIAHEQILEIIGAIDRKIIFNSSQAIITNDISQILEILDDGYYRGLDLKKFYGELIEHFRNLVIVKMGKNIDKLVNVPAHEIEIMQNQVQSVPQTYLIQILDLLFKQEPTLRMAADPKLVLEMTFIKAFYTKPALPIDELIQKLDALRQGLPPETSPPSTHKPHGPYDAATKSDQPVNVAADQPVHAQMPKVQKETPSPELPLSPTSTDRHTAVPERKTDQAAQAPKPVPQFNGRQTPREIWTAITKTFNEKHPALSTCLEESHIRSITDNSLTLEVTGTSFNLGIIKREKNMKALKKAVETYFGSPKKIKLIENLKNNQKTHQQKNENQKLKQEAMNHPLVSDAIEVFSGRIVDVKIL